MSKLADKLHAAARPLYEAIAEAIESQAGSQPEPQPGPQPEPQPQPTGHAAPLSASTTGEWDRGVSLLTTRVLISDTPENRKAFTKGAQVELGDGSVRRIVKSTAQYNAMFVELDGPKLDPEAIGHPNQLVAVEGVAEKPTPKPTPEPGPKPTPQPGRLGILGTNLGMGQGGGSVIPGVQGTNYAWPIESEIVRAKSYGFRRFRIGGLYERFFKKLGATEMYMGKDSKGKEYSSASVIRVGQLCKKHDCTILWNPFHNYGTVFGKKVGSAGGLTAKQFGQAWRAFILHVKSDPDAWAATYGFDLMNEWSGMEFKPIFDATQAVLDECADILEDKMICPEGKDFSSTANWVRNNDGFTELVDPRGPGFLEFHGHLYLDADASGYYKTSSVHAEEAKRGVTPATVGTHRLSGFADWIERNGYRGAIGETIVPGDMPELLKGWDNLLAECRRRGIDVYVFGMSDWFNDTPTTVHNLEIDRNKPTLELVRKYTS